MDIRHLACALTISFVFPTYVLGQQVISRNDQFINYYMGRGRTTMEVGIKRSGQFIDAFKRIFREEGVPEELAWMAQVESAWLIPADNAWSHSVSVGLWNFPKSKKQFGLKQNAYLDERLSFGKATRTTAKYLKFLADRYNGNWELAVAAYNCGEAEIDRAIARAGKTDFWAAYPYLPQETRNYVPNTLAVILINKDRAKYGFAHIEPLPPLKYDTIEIAKGTSLKLLAEAIGSTEKELRFLNPELIRGTTPPKESYPVRIPTDKVKNLPAKFIQNSGVK